MELPHRSMGRWAVEKALSLLEPRRDKYNVVKFECPLIERDSIGPPRTVGRPLALGRTQR